MLTKTERQKEEYEYQLQLLEGYENRFIRMCMLQLGLSGKNRVQWTDHLLGQFYKINRCRKQLRMNEIELDKVRAFLPNRPAPSGLLKLLSDDNVPESLRRKLTHPPHDRDESNRFWQYEKNLIHKWRQSIKV